MNNTHPTVLNFIRLFILLEWRLKFAVQGTLVQMFTSVFLIFLSLNSLALPVWNALFWLMILFNTINSIAKGFLQESEGKLLYYHSICKPESLIISKIVFNAIISLILLLIFAAVYSLVLGFKISNPVQYLLVAVLFTIGLSTVFTMVSAIGASSGSSGSSILVSVLGLPLVLPLLLVTVQTAKKAMDGIETWSIYKDMAVLGLMDLMLFYLSVVLFKFIWKN